MRKAKSRRRQEKRNTAYHSEKKREAPVLVGRSIPKIRKLSWTFNESPDPTDVKYADKDIASVFERAGVFDSSDSIRNPLQYISHPAGIECIQVTEHMNFNLGNAVKYIWRAPYREDQIRDLKKAAWYILREVSRLEQKKEE